LIDMCQVATDDSKLYCRYRHHTTWNELILAYSTTLEQIELHYRHDARHADAASAVAADAGRDAVPNRCPPGVMICPACRQRMQRERTLPVPRFNRDERDAVAAHMLPVP